MRTAWIALLLALLPLRGWVGDAMALSMLGAGGHAAPAALVADAHRHGGDHANPLAPAGHGEHGAAATHAAHAGHTAMVSVADAAAAEASADDHGGPNAHLLCEVCNGPVLNPPAPALACAPVEYPRLAERAQRFASLAPRQHTKPPIA